ncbi:MAG: zinc ribbon domain-containing protein [Candidatus Heimdallarchaeaceae archaeon]
MLSEKVDFCPVCGTELQPQVEDHPPSSPTQGFPSPPSISKIGFEDEPIATKQALDLYENDVQYAWRISNELLPLNMKGQVNYSEPFNRPKLGFNCISHLKKAEFVILIFLSAISSFSLLAFIGLTGLLLFYQSLSVKIIILTIGFLVFHSLINYFKDKLSSKFLVNNTTTTHKFENLKLNYSIIEVTHLAIIVFLLFLAFSFINIFSLSLPVLSVAYIVGFLLVVSVSLVSPPFKVARLFSFVRNSGVFQNIHDSFQMPKISIRRSVEIMIFSFLIPSAIIVGSINSIFKIFTFLFLSESQLPPSVWDIILFFVVCVALTLNFFFADLNDTETVVVFEELLSKFIAPPSLEWLSMTKQKQGSSLQHSGIDVDALSSSAFDEQETRCPFCSAIVIEGAEFCTDCGKKL